MSKGILLTTIRYCCPCDAGEVLQVVHTCRLEEGEEFFLMRMKSLYRQALREIEKHKSKAAETDG